METVLEEGQNKPKRQKIQEIADEGEEDRISALPDCLLLEILDRLPYTNQAIKTGSLSKRWKHVWTSVPSLIFHQYMHRLSDFFSDIDKTLTQCRQSKVKRFIIYTIHDNRYESQVNSWISYAIRCEVEELTILLSTVIASELVLDQNFFINSCFTSLKLAGCVLNPTGAITWKNLRSLCISDGEFNEDLIENILSGSPQLETLILDSYYGCRRLNITSNSVKNLEFTGDMVPGDESDEEDTIEINAPNILSLTIQCELLVSKLLLVNVSSLVKAELDYYNSDDTTTRLEAEYAEMLKGFILNLGHVKELKIGSRCSEALIYLENNGFTFPSNLKFPDDWSDRNSSSGDSFDSDSVSD
ncbi:hypothetical protein LXL04_027387 [Taraxacum kok-saghyz]